MIQISIFSMLLLIIVLHTILSHLMNWAFRKVYKNNEPFAVAVMVLIFLEALLIVQLFKYYLN